MAGLLLIALLSAPNPPAPPGRVSALDLPNDAGGQILVRWELSPDDTRLDAYLVERQVQDSGAFEHIALVRPGITGVTDDQTDDQLSYQYRVSAIAGADTVAGASSGYVRSRAQWFHTGRINVLVGLAAFGLLLVWLISRAKAGAKLFIRRISGLDAVDEALGRATEMGRPILFVPGIADMSYIGTIAAMNILGEVAAKTAHYQTPLIVPNCDPVVYTVAREMVKEGYTRAGRPDAFNPDSVYFVTSEQFPFAAAVDGIMVRERPATNFLIGGFWAESLIMAETGTATGAVQIAGTDQVTQLPFFVTACDYTLLGEELYAASAYLSREPLLLGAIKGQDYAKAIIVILLIVGTLLALTTRLPVTGLF
jgi:hypothetical protein